MKLLKKVIGDFNENNTSTNDWRISS
jgi:hypothetical protein